MTQVNLTSPLSLSHAREQILDRIKTDAKHGPRMFEFLCGFILQLHYKCDFVTVTQPTRDKGIDVVMSTNECVGVAQCKSQIGTIDPGYIHSFASAADTYYDHIGVYSGKPQFLKVFFAMGSFTDTTWELAKEKNINLIDGRQIEELVDNHISLILLQFFMNPTKLQDNIQKSPTYAKLDDLCGSTSSKKRTRVDEGKVACLDKASEENDESCDQSSSGSDESDDTSFKEKPQHKKICTNFTRHGETWSKKENEIIENLAKNWLKGKAEVSLTDFIQDAHEKYFSTTRTFEAVKVRFFDIRNKISC